MSSVSPPAFQRRWLHPRYWPLWLMFALWWLLVQLPYPVLIFLGRVVGRLLLRLNRQRRLITQRNLELCFPEKTQAEREALLKKSFESAGIAILEQGMAWWWPNRRIEKLTHVRGLEHVRALNGQGAILLGMHLVTLDVAGAGFSLRHPYGCMYRPHDNPLFDYIQLRGRFRDHYVSGERLVVFPRDDIRTMVRSLRQGKLVWYAPDQDYGAEHSVFAPFFGVAAATVTATAKLAQMGRARVLPFTHARREDGTGYDIVIHPPLEDYPTGNELADATRINQEIERHIRANPGQYLWAHRRFKTRPEGVPDHYPEITAERKARRAKRHERERKQS